jgi:hypothetical protein
MQDTNARSHAGEIPATIARDAELAEHLAQSLKR